MKSAFLLPFVVLCVSGCATMSSTSDWSRFSGNGPEDVCAGYQGYKGAKCIADGKARNRAIDACEYSSQNHGADFQACMRKNAALWVVYEDGFSYELRRAAFRARTDVSEKDYMAFAGLWEPLCIDASGDKVPCQ